MDAKVPRSEREAWPLVVRGDDVVAVPGIAAAPGWEDAVTAERDGEVTEPGTSRADLERASRRS